MENVQIHPSDLLSKWGFDDGELAAEILQHWIRKSHWRNSFQGYDRNQHLINYLNPVTLQAELVIRYIKPLLPLDPPSILERVYTMHNPIRLEPILTDSSPEYEDLITDLETKLTSIKPINIPITEVYELCQELYPKRPKGWLTLYSTLAHQFKFLAELNTTLASKIATRETFTQMEPYVLLTPYINELAEIYSDDHLLIASELVSNSTNSDWKDITPEMLTQALQSATLLLK